MMACLKDLDAWEPERAKELEKEIYEQAAGADGLEVWKQACKRVRLDGWYGPISDEEYNETELVDMPLGRALIIVRRSMQEHFSDIEFHNPDYPCPLGEEEHEGAEHLCPPNFKIPGKLIHGELWRWYREIDG